MCFSSQRRPGSVIEMNQPYETSRREFIRQSVAASTAFVLPSIVPAAVLGRDGAVAPSETISLGVIGIGPRSIYDLQGMLGFADVRCVAIADVQASRRDPGKRLVDDRYGNQDCKLYRDFR